MIFIPWNEGFPDLLASVRPDRNVLKVWIIAGQSSRYCHCLSVSCMYTTRSPVYQLWQRIDIGRFKFGVFAIFEDVHANLILMGKFHQHILTGGILPRLSLSCLGIKIQLFK